MIACIRYQHLGWAQWLKLTEWDHDFNLQHWSLQLLWGLQDLQHSTPPYPGSYPHPSGALPTQVPQAQCVLRPSMYGHVWPAESFSRSRTPPVHLAPSPFNYDVDFPQAIGAPKGKGKGKDRGKGKGKGKGKDTSTEGSPSESPRSEIKGTGKTK